MFLSKSIKLCYMLFILFYLLLFVPPQTGIARNVIKKTEYSFSKSKTSSETLLWSNRDTFPNFKLPDPNGKNIILYKQKVKFYVLISLWNSKCNFCVEEMKKLNYLYNTYLRKMTFISISNDTDKAVWKEFLMKNNLKGINVIDLNSDFSKYVSVKNIPSFILLDHNFKILQTFDNTESLKKQLNEYYFQYDNLMYRK